MEEKLRWKVSTVSMISKNPSFSAKVQSHVQEVATRLLSNLSPLLPNHKPGRGLKKLQNVMEKAALSSLECQKEPSEFQFITSPAGTPWNYSLMAEIEGRGVGQFGEQEPSAQVGFTVSPAVVRRLYSETESIPPVVIIQAKIFPHKEIGTHNSDPPVSPKVEIIPDDGHESPCSTNRDELGTDDIGRSNDLPVRNIAEHSDAAVSADNLYPFLKHSSLRMANPETVFENPEQLPILTVRPDLGPVQTMSTDIPGQQDCEHNTDNYDDGCGQVNSYNTRPQIPPFVNTTTPDSIDTLPVIDSSSKRERTEMQYPESEGRSTSQEDLEIPKIDITPNDRDIHQMQSHFHCEEASSKVSCTINAQPIEDVADVEMTDAHLAHL